MFQVNLLFLINLCLANLEIIENLELSELFTIYFGESNIIYQIPEADDATLISFQQDSFCQVKQQTVQTTTQQFTIIQQDDFINYEFETNMPLNFREFIGMVHINDGMLAITSDAIAYLIKFNYDNVLSKQGFTTYGNSVDFAGVVWQLDLKTKLQSNHSKDELPQLVYSKTNNLAFVIYSKSAQFFNVSEMESNDKSIQVNQISNWIQREERGLTKEIDGYLFSVVEIAGMDIYKINENNITYMYTITQKDFHLKKEYLELKDFAIIKVKEGLYQLYLLDMDQGLILAYMFINQKGLKFEIAINVESQQGGIAVDTKNGKNVFAAFQDDGIYFYIEYLINFDQKSYSIITKQESNYRIVDIDATEEFAIISGVNHHQIVFNNGYDFIAPQKEKILFTQIGMRDFQFFQYTEEEALLKDAVKNEYQYDDFFFGVTAYNAFLTKFKFVPARVICFVDHNNQESHSQYYNLSYNQSFIENNVVSTNKVIRTTKNFTVQVLKIFLFAKQWELIRLLLIGLGAILLISCGIIKYQFYKCKIEEANLGKKIKNLEEQNNESKLENYQSKQQIFQLQSQSCQIEYSYCHTNQSRLQL